MALQPVRTMSPTSPIAVTLRSRIMVLLPSIAHTGARLLSPFDLASQTSLASQHESTGALPPHARRPRIRRRISATGISSITSGTMGSAAATTATFRRSTGNARNAVTFWKVASRSASDDTSGLPRSSLPTSSLRSHRASKALWCPPARREYSPCDSRRSAASRGAKTTTVAIATKPPSTILKSATCAPAWRICCANRAEPTGRNGEHDDCEALLPRRDEAEPAGPIGMGGDELKIEARHPLEKSRPDGAPPEPSVHEELEHGHTDSEVPASRRGEPATAARRHHVPRGDPDAASLREGDP